jgi:predicted dehydrogenase
MKTLRLGIIGLSPGNGHPYSWSAIFNGYEAAVMATCPFPAIPSYLAKRSFPKDAIEGAQVTHIWCQDRSVAEHVAAASRIPNIVDRLDQMLPEIDALLLARDDADSHRQLAAPFLQAGLPVFVDKPLALSRVEAEAIYALQARPGLVFSCSALAYAEEFSLSDAELDSLGPLVYVDATTPKSWDTYAVHVIEPLLRLTAREGGVTEAVVAHLGRSRALDLKWHTGARGRVTALQSDHGDITIRLFGQGGSKSMIFGDSFTAFRSSLQHFVSIVRQEMQYQDPSEVLAVVDLIEAGRRA